MKGITVSKRMPIKPSRWTKLGPSVNQVLSSAFYLEDEIECTGVLIFSFKLIIQGNGWKKI